MLIFTNSMGEENNLIHNTSFVSSIGTYVLEDKHTSENKRETGISQPLAFINYYKHKLDSQILTLEVVCGSNGVCS